MHLLALMPLLLVAQPRIVAAPTPTAAPSCIACRVDVGEMERGYSLEEWQELTRGEIVMSKADQTGSAGSLRSRVGVSAILPSTPEQVWSVLADSESRPSYTPGLTESRTVRVEGNRVWLAQRVEIWWADIRYQIVVTLHPEEGSMTWVLDESVENDIAASEGSWQIAPLPRGRKTLVKYSAHVDTGKPVPGVIESFLTRRTLPKMVSGLRTEVQRRYPHGESRFESRE